MLLNVDATNRIAERVALRAMFEARKRIFVDLLKWDVPVLDDRYEIDEFDDAHAVYVILLDQHARHLASARLLPTTRPTILGTLFPDLCAAPPPVGDDVYEITRFCLSRDVTAAQRRTCRNMLVTALARYAVDHHITTYLGVAEEAWMRQILRFGWSCARLGDDRLEPSSLGAVRIDIAADTLDKLRATGLYQEADDHRSLACAA